MNDNDPDVALLEAVAARLGDDLLDELVFVGGAVAGLLITDPAMPAMPAIQRACHGPGMRKKMAHNPHGILAPAPSKKPADAGFAS